MDKQLPVVGGSDQRTLVRINEQGDTLANRQPMQRGGRALATAEAMLLEVRALLIPHLVDLNKETHLNCSLTTAPSTC
eukprot:scaffold1328_cov394-Prasinococcus_capsulatus_cf.AAC.28